MNRITTFVINGFCRALPCLYPAVAPTINPPPNRSALPPRVPPLPPPARRAPLPSPKMVGEAYKIHPEIPKHATASGMEIQEVAVGTGDTPKKGDNVTVEYTGWLANGQIFDTSKKQKGTPLSFPLGRHQVISGWEEGIATMKLGGKRILTIPPALAYGSTGKGSIPPDSTLVFEVELLGINDKKLHPQAPAIQVGPQLPQTQPATVPTQQAAGPAPQ